MFASIISVIYLRGVEGVERKDSLRKRGVVHPWWLVLLKKYFCNNILSYVQLKRKILHLMQYLPYLYMVMGQSMFG